MLEVDVTTYLAGDLIPKVDIATMAYALEARSPFLDHELMELAARIPAGLKVRAPRRSGSCARRCAAGCPTTSSTARSRASWCRCPRGCAATCARGHATSCSTPARWRAGYFRPDALTGLLDRHAAGADADDKRIWSLVMLELWHREFVDAPRSAQLLAA